MANRFRGEVTLDNGMIAVLDFNALATLEEVTGKGAFEVLEAFESGKARVTDLRAILFSVLVRHNPNVTVEDAGDLLSENQSILADVLSAASDVAEGGETKNAKPRAAKK